MERPRQRDRAVARRLPSGNVANIQTNILTAGELYGDRITQVDMRVAKILRFGRARVNVGLDV